MLMRFLKTLTICFCFLLVFPGVFAQSEPLQPKFSIGFSLGYPSSTYFSVRNVEIQGLALRAEFGGFYLVFAGYIQVALNELGRLSWT